MANNFRGTEEMRNAACNAYGVLFNAGTVQIRTNAPPATIGDPTGSALLATCGFSDPAYSPASGGSITADAISADTNAAGSGDAGHFVAFKADGTTPICQGTAGDSNDAPVDLEFTDSKTIVATGTVSISSWVINQP